MMRYEIQIKGRVQGVGFRYFVLKRALELNIKGYVRNLPDGSVYVSAEGEKNDLVTFTDYLRIGPALARIDQFITDKFEVSSISDRFIIK